MLDSNICLYENFHNNQTKSTYFSPHQAKSKWPNNRFSVFDNNITSLNQNQENLQTHILEENDSTSILLESLRRKLGGRRGRRPRCCDQPLHITSCVGWVQ